MKIFIMLLIYSVVPIVLTLLAYPRKTKEQNIFCYPISVKLIAAIAFFTLTLGTIMMWIQNPKDQVTVLLTFFSIPLYFGFMYLLISVICFRLVLYDTFFLYRNNIGSKHRFEYSDISKISICYKKGGTVEQYKIYIEGKTIKINYLMLNSKDFLKYIKPYLKRNNCHCYIETENKIN